MKRLAKRNPYEYLIQRCTVAIVFLGVVVGIIYPVAVTLVAKVIFPARARGRLVMRNQAVVGSELVGQKFESPIYFHGRLSATDYHILGAGSKSLGINSKDLTDRIAKDVARIRREENISSAVPLDLVTESGSGLDPHVSLEGILLQVSRVSRSRHVPEDKLQTLVHSHAETDVFGSGARVNVLRLNIALDNTYPVPTSRAK